MPPQRTLFDFVRSPVVSPATVATATVATATPVIVHAPSPETVVATMETVPVVKSTSSSSTTQQQQKDEENDEAMAVETTKMAPEAPSKKKS
jgi:uncharacterized membrane protein YdfJ with MMPL/SSD domain